MGCNQDLGRNVSPRRRRPTRSIAK
jgi:hypothetical protein